MKLFVYVKEGHSKNSYGIVEHYDGNNIIIAKLWVNDNCSSAYIIGWEQVKTMHCNILGYFPVNNNDFTDFLKYIETLPTCAG